MHHWTREQTAQLLKLVNVRHDRKADIGMIKHHLKEALAFIKETNKPMILTGMVTQTEWDRYEKELTALSKMAIYSAQSAEFPDLPKQLPYPTPPPTDASPFWNEQQVKTFRTFLTRGGAPHDLLTDPSSNANMASYPNDTTAVYMHTGLPKCRLLALSVTAVISRQLKYGGNPVCEWSQAFFSDIAPGVVWTLSYESNTNVKYMQNIGPFTTNYPGNIIAAWSTGAQLDAIADTIQRSTVAFTYNTDGFGSNSAYPYVPLDVNEIKWNFNLREKGIVISNQDVVKIVSGQPTQVAGTDQLERLYFTLDLEVIPFEFGQERFRQVTTVQVIFP